MKYILSPLLMRLFPPGSGIVAICISVFCIIMTIIYLKKGVKVAKNLFLMLAILSIAYFIVGLFLFFRPPYFSSGHVYFSSKIKEESIVQYLDSTDSMQSFVKGVVPDAQTYRKHQVKRKDSSVLNMECMNWSPENSRIEIVIYSYESDSEAKSEYDSAIASSRNEIPDKFLSIEDHNGWSFCAFPVTYDGAKFLLPFVDTSGAHVSMYAYYENTYVHIMESAEKYTLFLPNNVF